MAVNCRVLIEELDKKMEELKNQIFLLVEENKKLKENSQNFQEFIASNTGLYYIKLAENEKLTYKKN